MIVLGMNGSRMRSMGSDDVKRAPWTSPRGVLLRSFKTELRAWIAVRKGQSEGCYV